MQLAFLGIKDYRKIIKGQQRSWRSKQRPETYQYQNLKKIISLGSFSVSCLQFFVFSSYKVIKAKKATLVAENANLHLGFFIGQKLLLYHPKALFKLPFTKNRAGKWKTDILKAKMCHEGPKIEENWKITEQKMNAFFIVSWICFMIFLEILQFFGL